jgi:hypothetical protein
MYDLLGHRGAKLRLVKALIVEGEMVSLKKKPFLLWINQLVPPHLNVLNIKLHYLYKLIYGQFFI